MNVHALMHVPFEGLAGIGTWISAHGHSLTGTRFFEHDDLPKTSDVDMVIVMGGPMGVYDEQTYRWLKREKLFIEQCLSSGKTMLGVCLGAQLVAEVLGARVYRNRFKEIGWFPVQLTDEGRHSALFRELGDSFMAFHWHGDTFDLPRGAVHLARSEGCEIQAFSYGDNVLGLQMHLDSTEESIELLLQNCRDEIVPGPFIQPAEQIRGGVHHVSSVRESLSLLLDKLTGAKAPAERVTERKTIGR